MIPVLRQFGISKPPEYLTLADFILANDAVSPTFLWSEYPVGFPASGHKATVGLQLTQTGILKTATGSTEAALSFSTLGADFLAGGFDASLYEAKLTINSGGTGGTITGSATGSFVAITSTVSWHFAKDTSAVGTVTWNCDLEIREIADTGNTVSDTGFEVKAQNSL